MHTLAEIARELRAGKLDRRVEGIRLDLVENGVALVDQLAQRHHAGPTYPLLAVLQLRQLGKRESALFWGASLLAVPVELERERRRAVLIRAAFDTTGDLYTRPFVTHSCASAKLTHHLRSTSRACCPRIHFPSSSLRRTAFSVSPVSSQYFDSRIQRSSIVRLSRRV